MNYPYATTLIALGMAGFLSAVTQTPLTAFIIVMEMVDGHAMVLSLMACSLIASAISRMLAQPLASGFGLMLSLKILLALSVFGHFVTAMVWRRRGLLGGRRSCVLHLSVFCHMVAMVLLAKGMFHLNWA